MKLLPMLARGAWIRLGLSLSLALLLGLSLALGVSVQTAHAQTVYYISDCTDESQLQSAVTQANTNNDNDTIYFLCSGTIPFTSTLTISGSMTFDGRGHNVTLDGQNSVQVLHVNGGVTFTLTSLTVAHGSTASGGGLQNSGTLIVNNGIFTGNTASSGGGGLENEGTATINNSTFTGNTTPGNTGGGAIYNFASLTLTNSTFTSNSSADGGAIITSGGTVNISTSTFTHNTVTNGGGAFFNTGGMVTISGSTFAHNSATNSGGAIDTGSSGTTSVSNSTFASNSTGSSGAGGAISNGGTTNITNSTIVSNTASVGSGGGIFNFGSLSIGGSIVANNVGGNCFEPGGSFSDQGYNLENAQDCGFTGTGDKQKAAPKIDPKGLQNNGGPTLTIALQAGSPAIDAVLLSSTLCPATDQRGFTRPDEASETGCDMGAYEVNEAPDSDLALTNMPANITTTATSASGAVVNYTPPTVVDEDSPLPAVSCNPASGSTFAVGPTTVTCTATDSDDNNSPVSKSFTVTVKPLLTVFAPNLTVPEGSSATHLFAGGKAYGTSNPLTATINWGDGSSPTVLSITPTNGSYSISTSHPYAEEGSYSLSITVNDRGTLSATKNSTITVSDAPLKVNSLSTSINGLTVKQTGAFRDADQFATLSDYTATIDWGDSTSSPVTLGPTSSPTSFSISDSHTYAAHGTYTLTLTITDAGGSTVTQTVSITV